METEIITALGGNRAVADALGVTINNVALWKSEGRSIPWKYRPKLAKVAAERGVPLPVDFWEDEK